MTKKTLSTLPVFECTTQWQEPSQKATLEVLQMLPHVRLEEQIEQALKALRLVQEMGCRRLHTQTTLRSERTQRLNSKAYYRILVGSSSMYQVRSIAAPLRHI